MLPVVKSWMSGDPAAILADASALEALELMVDRGIRHLPVVDAERRVVGVLSVDDLRAALPVAVSPRSPLSPSDRELAREWRVEEIMTHAPETVGPDTEIGEAAERMADRRIGCLPVVDPSGRLEGLLSETDLLYALATTRWSERIRDRRGTEAPYELLVEGLRREREAIASRLDRYHALERDLARDQAEEPRDPGERATDANDLRLTETLDAAAARRLDAIDRALDRAAEGALGVCAECGGAIPATRLRALPGTTRCVACARAAEGRTEAGRSRESLASQPEPTVRPRRGAQVTTRFGEGRLARIVPFGSCRRCGDVEGREEPERERVVCASCGQPLRWPLERAIVEVGEREVYVDPAEIEPVDPEPYD
jgi:CBS domain-containing protein/RNA polymerase-binding transcription factor DksA